MHLCAENLCAEWLCLKICYTMVYSKSIGWSSFSLWPFGGIHHFQTNSCCWFLFHLAPYLLSILSIHHVYTHRLHKSFTQIAYTNRLHKSFTRSLDIVYTNRLHKSFSRVFFKVRVFSQENICNRNYVMVCGPGEDGQRGERIPKGGKKGKGKACRPCRLPSHHCGFGSDVEVYIRYRWYNMI